MAHIPTDVEWFLAELVQVIEIEGEPNSILHVNLVLVKARSPEEAFDSAAKLGLESETSYMNPKGQRVNIRYAGLAELHVVHEPLEHGAELLFTEHTVVNDEEIRAVLRPREELAVFRTKMRESGKPDYSSRAILDEAASIMERGSTT